MLPPVAAPPLRHWRWFGWQNPAHHADARSWFLRHRALALATMVTASLACFQEFSALMRQKGAALSRHAGQCTFIHYHGFSSATPEALRKTRADRLRCCTRQKLAGPETPVLMLIVVGETVRSANWGYQATRGRRRRNWRQRTQSTFRMSPPAAPTRGIGTLHVFAARPSQLR